MLVAEEETVTGRTGRNALALELVLGRKAEIFRRRTGSDDQCIAGIRATVPSQTKRALREFGGMDMIEQDFGIEALGVFLHALHQTRALQAFDITRPVVHFGRGHELTALLQSGDQDRLEIGARRIHRGGVARGTGTEDEKTAVLGCAHV